jgi:hypothetical protein
MITFKIFSSQLTGKHSINQKWIKYTTFCKQVKKRRLLKGY